MEGDVRAYQGRSVNVLKDANAALRVHIDALRGMRSRLPSATEFDQVVKDINKTERLEIQKRNQLMNTHKAIDTLHFMTAKKKKNNIDGMEKAKKAKEQRELLRQNYLKDKELENKYLKIDPKKLPASIFLHKDVLEKYGLCPFLVIDLDLDEDNLIKIQIILNIDIFIKKK